MDLKKESLEMHKKNKGKLEVTLKTPIKNRKDLSLAYTPGVGEVCKVIAEDKSKVFDYTIKNDTIAVITDGSAVLGLGNIGPEAALPVMEGKSALFKVFGGVNSFPICLDTQDSNEIIDIVKKISPVFAGINLEDIAAPRCFEIEDALQDLRIPVFHDDQHGTAVVVLAGLINALKVTGKRYEDLKIVINGAGAAGIAVVKMLINYGKEHNMRAKNIIVLDSKGSIYHCREYLNSMKKYISTITNEACNHENPDPDSERCKNCMKGDLSTAIKDADVFIGVSKAGLLTKEMVNTMNEGPIIFAMANPVPEIMPDEARDAGAAIIGTGRSDFKNQINNSLAFPGIFKGAIAASATKITDEMKLAAAYELADCVQDPKPDKIIPGPFESEVVVRIANAVKNKAIEQGVIRKS